MKKDVILADEYAGLQGEIVSVVGSARLTAVRSVNAVMTAAHWEIGRRIVTVEQGGRERAEYEQALPARLAVDLTRRFGRVQPGEPRQHACVLSGLGRGRDLPDSVWQIGVHPENPDAVWQIPGG